MRNARPAGTCTHQHRVACAHTQTATSMCSTTLTAGSAHTQANTHTHKRTCSEKIWATIVCSGGHGSVRARTHRSKGSVVARAGVLKCADEVPAAPTQRWWHHLGLPLWCYPQESCAFGRKQPPGATKIQTQVTVSEASGHQTIKAPDNATGTATVGFLRVWGEELQPHLCMLPM